MLIDSCASGGRRNDLETLRRAVPLLRSDLLAPHAFAQQGAVLPGVHTAAFFECFAEVKGIIKAEFIGNLLD